MMICRYCERPSTILDSDGYCPGCAGYLDGLDAIEPRPYPPMDFETCDEEEDA